MVRKFPKQNGQRPFDSLTVKDKAHQQQHGASAGGCCCCRCHWRSGYLLLLPLLSQPICCLAPKALETIQGRRARAKQ